MKEVNKTDCANIREIIEWLDEKPELERGGNYTGNELFSMSKSKLEKMLEGYEVSRAPEFKELVDRIFEKYGDEESNFIPLTCACAYDNYVRDGGDPYDKIDWDGFNHKYNKLYYPVEDPFDESDDKWSELFDELHSMAERMGIPTAEDYFEDGAEELNEIWYGVIGVMKDYKVVSFVIRDDGWLGDWCYDVVKEF